MAAIAMPGRLAGKHLELPAVLALASLGGAVGFGVVRLSGFVPTQTEAAKLEYLGSKHHAHLTRAQLQALERGFSQSAEFKMWLFLILLQTALWIVAAAVLLSPELRGHLSDVWSRGRVQIATAVGVTALPLVTVAVGITLTSNIGYPIRWHTWKILALSLGGIGVALIGIAELASLKFLLERNPVDRSAAGIRDYLRLRGLLQRVLAIEGAIIGAAVLASGGLRNAVVAWDGVLSKNGMDVNAAFPREYVLMYGAFFTVLLALLYAPVYFKLLDVGRDILDDVCPIGDPKAATWLPAYEKRKAMEGYLQLEIATSSSFRAGVAILAPLASALVALLLGTA